MLTIKELEEIEKDIDDGDYDVSDYDKHVGKLLSHISEINKKLDQWEREDTHESMECYLENKQLSAKLKIAKEALEFYADGPSMVSVYTNTQNERKYDEAQKAREALEKMK